LKQKSNEFFTKQVSNELGDLGDLFCFDNTIDRSYTAGSAGKNVIG
jgi:hypothetical protein